MNLIYFLFTKLLNLKNQIHAFIHNLEQKLPYILQYSIQRFGQFPPLTSTTSVPQF